MNIRFLRIESQETSQAMRVSPMRSIQNLIRRRVSDAFVFSYNFSLFGGSLLGDYLSFYGQRVFFTEPKNGFSAGWKSTSWSEIGLDGNTGKLLAVAPFDEGMLSESELFVVSDTDANYNYAYAFDHIGNRATETVAMANSESRISNYFTN